MKSIAGVNVFEKALGTCSLPYSGKLLFSIGLNVSNLTFYDSWIMDLGTTGSA